MIDTEFDLKNNFLYIKSRKSSSILMKIRKMLFFFKSDFSIIVFQYQSKIIHVIEIKEKRINFLFIAVICMFPVIDLNEHINTILYLLRNFIDVYA